MRKRKTVRWKGKMYKYPVWDQTDFQETGKETGLDLRKGNTGSSPVWKIGRRGGGLG